MDNAEAAELVNSAKGGDRSALDRLFSGVEVRLVHFIRSRMGATLRTRAEPEDVLQETILRAWRSIGQFRWHNEASFRRWLEGIAGHVLADTARASRRRKELQISRDPTGRGEPPSKHMRREERFTRLRKAIDNLSPDHRTVILLSRIEGLMIREIATRMGRSQSAVKNLLLRALRELKKSFGHTDSLHLGSCRFSEEELHRGE